VTTTTSPPAPAGETAHDEAPAAPRRPRAVRGQRIRRLQRGLVLVVVAVVPVVFTRSTLNAFSAPKALLAWLIALVLLALGLVVAARTRRVTVGRPGVWAALAAFVLGLLAATATADIPGRALVGDHTRFAGLVGYAAGIVLFATTAAVFRRDARDRPLIGDHPVAGLLRTLMLAGIVIAGYGAMQALYYEPLGWTVQRDDLRVFATLGNPNFLAGWLAIMGMAGLWGTLTRTWSLRWRAASVVLTAVAFLATLATTSAQGPLAWAIGGALLGGVWLWSRPDLRGRLGGRRSLAVGLVALIVGIGLSPVVGAFGGVADEVARSYRDRTTLFQTAVAMGIDHPLTGVGLEAFGDHYHQYRPLHRAVRYHVRPAATQVHNVPLHLFAGGGLPLLLGWLAWVAAVGTVLVRGLRRLDGERRLLLGGAGAAWVAYLAQAMVSIDIPGLLTIGWILGGAVLAAAPLGRTSTVAVPRASAVAAVVLAVAVLVGGGAAWSTRLPAEVAGADAARRSDIDVIERRSNLAMSLERWETAYPLATATNAQRLNRPQYAIALLDEAILRNPRLPTAHLDRARISARLGDVEEAVASYEDVIALVPTTPSVLREVADYLDEHGFDARAEELRRRAQAVEDAVEARRS
jgi:putative inorganic carbon (hco3(-)) transporter